MAKKKPVTRKKTPEKTAKSSQSKRLMAKKAVVKKSTRKVSSDTSQMRDNRSSAAQFRKMINQGFRDFVWESFTPLQKKFFSIPELVWEAGQYKVSHHGSEAYLGGCGEEVQLGMIQTAEEQRKQGHASKLMEKICGWADTVGVTLSLRVDPKAAKIGMTRKQLVEWYRRYGFEGEWHRMVRPPQKIR